MQMAGSAPPLTLTAAASCQQPIQPNPTHASIHSRNTGCSKVPQSVSCTLPGPERHPASGQPGDVLTRVPWPAVECSRLTPAGLPVMETSSNARATGHHPVIHTSTSAGHPDRSRTLAPYPSKSSAHGQHPKAQQHPGRSVPPTPWLRSCSTTPEPQSPQLSRESSQVPGSTPAVRPHPVHRKLLQGAAPTPIRLPAADAQSARAMQSALVQRAHIQRTAVHGPICQSQPQVQRGIRSHECAE